MPKGMDRTIRLTPAAVQVILAVQREKQDEDGIPVSIAKIVNMLVIQAGKASGHVQEADQV